MLTNLGYVTCYTKKKRYSVTSICWALPKILSADFAGVGHIGRIGQGISTPRGAPVIKTREIKTIIIIL